jgi:hypothetical protein
LDQSALISLMVELFAAIKLLSAYPSPADLPEVHLMPLVEIQRQVCGGRPCHIKAFYHPDWGVVVDEALDLRNDPFDRSILLHELVHHLQKATGKYQIIASFCSRRISEEIEAYEIQNRYLSAIHAPRHALAAAWAGKCADDDEAFKPGAAARFGGD